MVKITTLNNRQYCVIMDPVGKDGKPQMGQKKLIKVNSLFDDCEEEHYMLQIII